VQIFGGFEQVFFSGHYFQIHFHSGDLHLYFRGKWAKSMSTTASRVYSPAATIAGTLRKDLATLMTNAELIHFASSRIAKWIASPREGGKAVAQSVGPTRCVGFYLWCR
jgi:hypothetical protein